MRDMWNASASPVQRANLRYGGLQDVSILSGMCRAGKQMSRGSPAQAIGQVGTEGFIALPPTGRLNHSPQLANNRMASCLSV